MSTLAKRILTTHAGSLPRPVALTRLHTARSRGEAIDEKLLESEGSEAVPWVVAQQRACGLDVISNGEQQRESFVLYLRRRLGGIGGVGGRLPFADVEAYPKFKEERTRFMAGREAVSNVANLPRCIGALSYQGRAELDAEIADFKAAMGSSGAAAPFFTAASPGILATIVKDDHYKDVDAYLEAIAQCLRIEYEAIIAAGFTLQIDAPDLAMERHSAFGDKPLGDFQKFIEKIIGAINRALVNIPKEKVRLHACWGNYEGPHDHDVPLRDILPILKTAKAGALFLPFANPQHAHEYKVLRDIPLNKDQVLIAGVIDTTTNYLEHPETVADRLERIAEAMGGPERVMAGTDCGFDTSAGMGRVAEDIVWAKLRALSAGAGIASKRLYA
jgi:5-methyltetrahydropteroyltriglutamate--homocysteine methyltransferase